MIDYKTIAEKIRSCRAEKDISQEKLIALMQDRGAGISRNTLSALENGEQVKLSLESWQVLCELMGCDFGFLLGEHACKTLDAQGIVNYTGLSEDCITTLANLKLFEKVFLERLLNPQSRLHLYELSDSYTKYREFVDLVRTYGIDGAEIPDSDMMDLITDENKMAYMRFKLSDAFLRFVDDSTK